MTLPVVLPLTKLVGLSENRVGSKAFRLAELCALGHPVPPAAVVTITALEAVVQEARMAPLVEASAAAMASGDSDRALAAGAEVVAALLSVPLPESVQLGVRGAIRRLAALPLERRGKKERPVLFVVRSSAGGEDGAERSHAGQYESLLNLSGEDRIFGALRSVWASWYSPRAIRYRLHARSEAAARRDSRFGSLPRGPVVPPMAVILQRMVLPRASGMLFTAHPVTGSRKQMIVESGPGLGEALAQGRIHPDYFLVEPRLDGRAFRIVERGIAPKDRELVPKPPGSGELAFQTLPAGRQRKATLTDRQIRALCRMGRAVQSWQGSPVDLEWTLGEEGTLWLVQARPVTGLKAAGGRAQGTGLYARPTLWTQRFAGERWTEQATPLGWSIVRELLDHFIHWEDASEKFLGGEPPTRLYRGRPYFNVSIFRFLAFRAVGGRPPQFLLEMFPEEEQVLLRNRSPRLPHLGLVVAILRQGLRERRWERYCTNILTNHEEWEAFQPRFEEAIAGLSLDFTEPRDGLHVVDEARELMVRYLSIHLLSLLFAHISYELLDRALRSWVGLAGDTLRSALVAEPWDNRTLDTNEALWELAEVARAHPELAARLREDAEVDVDGLAVLAGGPAFLAALDGFLERFGHRSSASWEIFATRWADSPEWVLKLVASSLRGRVQQRPADRARRRASDRDQAERLVRSRMGRTVSRRLVPWRQRLFAQLLHHARRYMALRENQRFSFDRLLLRSKRIFERLGALLERDGLLAGGENIVFLEWAEVQALVRGDLEAADAADRVRERQEAFLANQGATHPDFLLSDGSWTQPVFEDSEGLVGLPISSGRVTGPVRVLHSLDDVHKLQPGEVLVTRAVDPGWTPLFLTASALVLELGSVLSHGAVVAREYGLPAVVNVEGATQILQDGQWVTVDGDLGRVMVHRAQNDPPVPEQDVNDQGIDD